MEQSFEFSTYSIRTQVYLNPQSREYNTILVIDRMPSERTPFRNMVSRLNMVPLSPYRSGHSPCSRQCMYALTTSNLGINLFDQCVRERPYMGVSDIPVLITMLSRWGYKVDTSMNSIISRISPVPESGQLMNGNSIVCYISIGN